jgi:hypothetical protein
LKDFLLFLHNQLIVLLGFFLLREKNFKKSAFSLFSSGKAGLFMGCRSDGIRAARPA